MRWCRPSSFRFMAKYFNSKWIVKLHVTLIPRHWLRCQWSSRKADNHDHISLVCRSSIHLYIYIFFFIHFFTQMLHCQFFKVILPASSSLEMRTRSTLSSFGWLGNCMLAANATNTSLHMYFFSRSRMLDRWTHGRHVFPYTDFGDHVGRKINDTCTSAHLLSLRFDIKSTFFIIFFNPKCTFSLSPSLPVSCRI